MNTGQPYRIVVAALLQQEAGILLVRQQGAEDPAPSWTLPGGVVEQDERLGDALQREISQETGLQLLELGPLIYAVQAKEYETGHRTTSFIFEASRWQGEVAPHDPDDLILEARFMPVDSAIEALSFLPWQVMREPILAYLQGSSKLGTFWLYRSHRDGQANLVERLQDWEHKT